MRLGGNCAGSDWMFVQFSCTWPLNVSVALSVPFLNFHTQSTKNGNYSVISRLGLANGILFMGSCSITLTWVHGFCLSNTWKDYYCGCCRKHASPLKWLMVYELFLNGEPPLYVFTSCCFHLFFKRNSKDASCFFFLYADNFVELRDLFSPFSIHRIRRPQI